MTPHRKPVASSEGITSPGMAGGELDAKKQLVLQILRPRSMGIVWPLFPVHVHLRRETTPTACHRPREDSLWHGLAHKLFSGLEVGCSPASPTTSANSEASDFKWHVLISANSPSQVAAKWLRRHLCGDPGSCSPLGRLRSDVMPSTWWIPSVYDLSLLSVVYLNLASGLSILSQPGDKDVAATKWRPQDDKSQLSPAPGEQFGPRKQLAPFLPDDFRHGRDDVARRLVRGVVDRSFTVKEFFQRPQAAVSLCAMPRTSSQEAGRSPYPDSPRGVDFSLKRHAGRSKIRARSTPPREYDHNGYFQHTLYGVYRRRELHRIIFYTRPSGSRCRQRSSRRAGSKQYMIENASPATLIRRVPIREPPRWRNSIWFSLDRAGLVYYMLPTDMRAVSLDLPRHPLLLRCPEHPSLMSDYPVDFIFVPSTAAPAPFRRYSFPGPVILRCYHCVAAAKIQFFARAALGNCMKCPQKSAESKSQTSRDQYREGKSAEKRKAETWISSKNAYVCFPRSALEFVHAYSSPPLLLNAHPPNNGFRFGIGELDAERGHQSRPLLRSVKQQLKVEQNTWMGVEIELAVEGKPQPQRKTHSSGAENACDKSAVKAS
ncbi:hypothetical protein C8R43DRAFT_959249 [Mycena crocata]|nr:hypothetical protein C8R43DRAFT_959249 [Mycena crocata]